MWISKNKISILVVSGILVSIGMLAFPLHRPNLYQPGRGAIVEAAKLIRETYSEEQILQKKFMRVQKTLKKVVDYLDLAEKLDPKDKKEIEAMKRELIALDEYAVNISEASFGHRSKYDKIIEKLRALLIKTEDSNH